LGWTWGYGRALATNTLVQGNHVHHIGRLANGDGPILSDMAGIYTLGLHRGTVIRSNLWHDCAGLRYGGWGIYFDEGTTEILAEKNLVIRTTHGGFHQHYGRDNVVRNNIFVDARDFQIQRTRLENHRSFTFERNIVAWKRGRLLEGNFEGATNVVFASNLYWPGPGGEVKFWKWNLAEWRQRGQDQASLVEDPKFTDPAKDDYTLRPDSPALRLHTGQSSLLTQRRHSGCFPARSRFDTCVHTPICSRRAIHASVIVVSRRSRRATRTLPGSPLRRSARFSSAQPNFANSSRTNRSAFASSLSCRSAP
jgi:hypothetical protein